MHRGVNLTALRWNEKGNEYMRKQEYGKAIECYEKAIKTMPESEKLWTNKGYAYLCKGEYELALKCFERAIEINPAYHKAWFNKGETLAKMGMDGNATRCYIKAMYFRNETEWLYALREESIDPCDEFITRRMEEVRHGISKYL